MKKKLIILLLCLALLMPLIACKQGNDLFKAASPTTSALHFTCSDGNISYSAWLYDAAKEQSLLNELSKVNATSADGWTPEKAGFPIYGLNIMDTSGNPIETAWSNGYLILQDGSVYKFDYDFSKWKDTYEWEDITERAHFPNQYYLARNEGQWYSKFLTPAEHEPAPEYITLAISAVEDGRIIALLTNESSEEWVYGESFSLDVLLDGVWYSVPTEPSVNWGFTSLGYILSAGDSSEEAYSLVMFGDLPAGTYRLVVDGLTAEFTL